LPSKTQNPKEEKTALQEEFSALVRDTQAPETHPGREKPEGENCNTKIGIGEPVIWSDQLVDSKISPETPSEQPN